PATEQVRVQHQSQSRQGARPGHPQQFGRPRRRGDRMMDRLKNTIAPPAGKTRSLLPQSADKSGWRQITGPLFRKYVALFLAVVCVALLSNGLFEIWFSYREHRTSLIRIQREQAESAAAKIGQFIREIESQVGWTTQLPWSAGTIDQRRFDGLQ